VKAPAHERLGDIYPALATTHFDVSGLRHAQRPNDSAHQPGRPGRQYTSKHRNAGPVWCSKLFGAGLGLPSTSSSLCGRVQGKEELDHEPRRDHSSARCH
jgi:hypothetical protein